MRRRLRRRRDGGILVEHRPLERLQLLPGLDAELVHERLARGAVRRERVGLAAGAIEREHLLGAEALAVRVLRHERVELRHELRVLPEREVGIDPLFECAESLLFEPAGRRRGERLAVEVGKRRTTPERERLARPRLRSQPGELVEVRAPCGNVEHVPRGARAERGAVLPERLPQAGHVHLQRGARRLRRRIPPELVDQPLGRDDAVRVQQEQREHRPLLARPEVELDAVALGLERAEKSEP